MIPLPPSSSNPSPPLYLLPCCHPHQHHPNMAITHDDLSRRHRRRATDTTSRLALLLVVLAILCGLSSFILCLSAEASRSEATWFVKSTPDNGQVSECVYSGSGKTPLGCAIAAFLLLAIAMFIEHAYMLVSVTSPTSPALEAWAIPPTDPSAVSPSYKALTWQACFLFLASWVCFAVAEVLLMIGLSVESGHLTGWNDFRPRCTIIRPGLFAAAGVLGLTTVFLGVGLYLTALRMQRLHQEEEGARQGAPRRQWVPSAPREPHPTGLFQNQLPQESQTHPKASASV